MNNKEALLEKNPIKGVMICIIAYFFLSLIALFQKLVSPEIPISIVLFFQNVICLIIVIPEIIKKRTPLKAKHFGAYLIRIISGIGCYATLFYTVRFIPVSEALLYQYSGSLWIPFVMLIWTKVSMPKNLWYGIIIGFIGVAIILKPTESMFGVISVLGIICGICQGVSVVAVRKLSATEPTIRILFYYFIANIIITTPFVVTNWVSLSLNDVAFLAGVGVCSYLGQKFFTIASLYANAATLAPICYISIPISGLIAWFLWNEIPESVTIAGMALVIFGCLLSLAMARQNSKLQQS